MNPVFSSTPLRAAALLALGVAGCSSINEKLTGEKIDYKTTGSKSVSLEVPPDLSQLSRDSRYQPVGGAISASTLQGAAAQAPGPAASSPDLAPAKVGSITLERAGTQRWIATPQTPEQLWPQLQVFWGERGFALELEQRETGLMETNWVENRAKLPQDIIRRSIGSVIGALYDTGERDRFRTRLERAADGRTEIYISHRGMVEVYTDQRNEITRWQPRPADPDLEAVMLSRLMRKLGATEEQAKAVEASATTAAAAAPAASRARLVGEPVRGLQVDEGFDRAWRRVGLALDRSGFTVEDRDRSQGQYFVRYVDPNRADKPEPGIFTRLFGAGKDDAGAPVRYRIALEGRSESTLVTVLDSAGGPANGPTAQRILELLVTDLR